jgi:nicotinate dehydrogenase subunit B
VPLYDFPAWHVVKQRVLTMPLRTSALRALGAVANVFAIESFVDELADAIGTDPIAFRLAHLRDARAIAVIERAVAMSKWRDWRPAEGRGHGIGFAKYKNTGAYCAVVAEIDAEAEIRVARLTIAVDVGRAINPDGVINQIEGGAIQATSWVLKERVRFDRQRITSNSWASYPILRFSEVPEVQVELIPRPDSEPLGAGEAAHGPVTSAIANAVFDALGVRVRDLPITRDSLIAAMERAS